MQPGYLAPLPMSGGQVPFSVPNVMLTPNAPNYLVVTVSDQSGYNESAPMSVPIIGAYGTGTMGPSLMISCPPTQSNICPGQTVVSISGSATVVPGMQGLLVRCWSASASAPSQKDTSNGGYAVQLAYYSAQHAACGSMPFTLSNIPLTANSPNYFVLTASDQYGNNESAPMQISGGMPLPVPPPAPVCAKPAAPMVRKPSEPRVVNDESFTIRGQAPANSIVQVWRADFECEKIYGLHALGAAQMTGSDTRFMITVRLEKCKENRFVVTATLGGVESDATPVPPIIHEEFRGAAVEEEIVIVEEEAERPEVRGKPGGRPSRRRNTEPTEE
jgi:hypothetical protein